MYLVTGKWLAEQGQLPVDAAVGPFAQSDAVDPAPPVKSGGSPLGFFPSGYPDDPSPTADLQPQFVHLYPSLLGTADWIGGNRLAQSLPALIGAVALLALFVLAARWMQPWAAAGATIAVAVSLPQAFFSRDTFSEVPVQLFLCARHRGSRSGHSTATTTASAPPWSPASSSARRWRRASTRSSRWWRCPFGCRRGGSTRPRLVSRRVLFLGVGVAVGIAIAVVDLLWRSRPYYELHRTEILSQVALFAAATIGAFGAAMLIPRWAWLRAHVTRWRRPIAWVGAVGHGRGRRVRVVRAPAHRDDDRGARTASSSSCSNAEGLAINSLRRYYEHSMEWLSWYLGPVTLALGVIGVAIAVWWVISATDDDRGWRSRSASFLAPTVLYLWRARAVPDQMWVMRRFLPVTIPGVALACFAVLAMMWRTRDISSASWPCSSVSRQSSCPRSCCGRCGARRPSAGMQVGDRRALRVDRS